MQVMTRRKFFIAASAGAAALTISSIGLRASLAAGKIRLTEQDALLVIDVIPTGSLSVAQGAQIVPLINNLAGQFKSVVITQHWHPTSSFASSQPGLDHRVQDIDVAKLHSKLDIPHAQLVIRTGLHQDGDTFSAFLEADRKTGTGLAEYLGKRGLKRVFCAGPATDVCVSRSALDARSLGFDALVIEDACSATLAQQSPAASWKEKLVAGVERVRSDGLGSA